MIHINILSDSDSVYISICRVITKELVRIGLLSLGRCVVRPADIYDES